MSAKRICFVPLAVACLQLPSTTAAQTFITSWGAVGPLCVAIGGSGRVYVSDEGDHSVKVFTSNGALLGQWPVPHGPPPNNWASPGNIAVDTDDNVWVDSRMSIDEVDLLKFTSAGTLVAQFVRSFESIPLAVDVLGNVYVSDKVNARVQVFTSSGAYLREWGTPGRPDGLAVDATGNVYVTHPFDGVITKFANDGTYLTQWGGGAGDGQFYPVRVAIGPDGRVFASDFLNHRVQVFTSDGAFVTMWGTPGTAEGQFYFPLGIAVDSNGYIYVVDKNNTRIQKFGFTPTPVAGATWGSVKARYRGVAEPAGQAR